MQRLHFYRIYYESLIYARYYNQIMYAYLFFINVGNYFVYCQADVIRVAKAVVPIRASSDLFVH